MKPQHHKVSRLKRSESFLGIHFDFHADERSTEVGKETTVQSVEHILEKVQPDYVQIDCKGHRGFSSYPTKAGVQAPGIIGDPLQIWRDVTANRGVSLYMHYSGVWDTEAIVRHPEWARIDEEGNTDSRMTSVFGPYVDQLMLPQLKELAGIYEVDGAWVDGECWATRPDYSEEAIRQFKEETGFSGDIPRSPDDPHFAEYIAFCREGFRRYMRHYVDEMHKSYPNFEIASNWAFSSYMPEPVTIDVDFISGDLALQNSVNRARLEGRFMAAQGKPWDLMSWAFSCKFREGGKAIADWCMSYKTPVQLKQEAAQVLALGGGFQAYFQQHLKDGSIFLPQLELMQEVARFCRERQQFCHGAESVPQIALVYSTYDYYRKHTELFGTGKKKELTVPLQGVLQQLLDAQYAVDIRMEHQLHGRMSDYPLIIVAECNELEQGFREELLQYVEAGGHLLLIGPKAAAMVQEALDVSLELEPEEAKSQWLEHNGKMAGLFTHSQSVKLGLRAVPFGRLYAENNDQSNYWSAATMASYGKGKIAATYLNMGERYFNARTSLARDFLDDLVRELFPKPLVVVKGSHDVDVTVNQLKGKLAVNLLNTSGPHTDPRVYTYDEIPSVGPLEVIIRTKCEPDSVILEPGGERLPYVYDDGATTVTLKQLDIHGVIVLDMNLIDIH